MKLPKINGTTLLTVGGMLLAGAGSVMSVIANDKKQSSEIAKAVAEELAKQATKE